MTLTEELIELIESKSIEDDDITQLRGLCWMQWQILLQDGTLNLEEF